MYQKDKTPKKNFNEIVSNADAQDFQRMAEDAKAQDDWKKAAECYQACLNQRAIEFALINSVQEGLSSNSEMQAIYDLVGDKLRDTFNAQIVMISQYDSQTNKVFHHYAIEKGQHLKVPGWNPIDASRYKIVVTKKPLMINQEEINALLEEQKMKVVPGTEVPKTWLGVPLMVRNEVRGIVSLQNLDIENAFTSSDIELLNTLTNSMAQSLENARLFDETQRLLAQMESEMGLARQAQKSILPTLVPEFSGYDIGSLIIPARAVGGDFYDFIHLDNKRLCTLIGDVSGKGLPAALFMAITFSLARVESGRETNQKEILENINNFLLKMKARTFVTFLYSVLDVKTGILNYSRAGHLPPILVNQEGEIVDIPLANGQPLGIFNQFSIDQQKVTIPRGGLVMFFSDGLYEAFDAKGNAFGLARVKKLLVEHRHEPAKMICEELWSSVEAFSGEIPHQDDFTVVIIKRV